MKFPDGKTRDPPNLSMNPSLTRSLHVSVSVHEEGEASFIRLVFPSSSQLFLLVRKWFLRFVHGLAATTQPSSDCNPCYYLTSQPLLANMASGEMTRNLRLHKFQRPSPSPHEFLDFWLSLGQPGGTSNSTQISSCNSIQANRICMEIPPTNSSLPRTSSVSLSYLTADRETQQLQTRE